MKKSIKLLCTAVTSGLLASSLAQADDHKLPETYGYVGAHASHYWFEDFEVMRGLDKLEDYTTLGLQGGYRFKPNWSVQLWWERDTTRAEELNSESGVQNNFLTARYHFTEHYIGGWEPYAGAMLGHQKVSLKGPKEIENTLIGPEIGIQHMLGERFVFDLGGRAPYNLDQERWDGEVYAGLNFIFGAADQRTASPATEPAAATEPAPAEDTAAPAAVVVTAPVDSDQDGIADRDDQCPDTPAGALVDDSGCTKMLEESIDITLRVEFETGKAVVKQSSYPQIEDVAKAMTQYPDTTITLEGHTDNTGNAAFNRTLSGQRADAVKAVLVEQFGIESQRINTVGKGEDEPVADNSTAAGRAENRRVEARIEASRHVPQSR